LKKFLWLQIILSVFTIVMVGCAGDESDEKIGQPQLNEKKAVLKQIHEEKYRFAKNGEMFQAVNLNNNFNFKIDKAGKTTISQITSEKNLSPAEFSLRFNGIGRSGSLAKETPFSNIKGICNSSLRKGTKNRCIKRVELKRKGITEWYDNREEGIEHGFDIENRPDGEGKLVISMKVENGYVEETSTGAAIFVEGVKRAFYKDLFVIDSSGKKELGKITAKGDEIQLKIDDSSLTYPIIVDPLITTAMVLKRTGSNSSLNSLFGMAIDMSHDTIAAATYATDATEGEVYIFQRDQGGTDQWQEVTIITPADTTPVYGFGQSVAIDGDNVIVGAPFTNESGTYSGAAYIFSRNHGGMNNWGQVKKITPTDLGMFNHFGKGVDIHGDKAVVGAYGTNFGIGSAYIFEQNLFGTNNWGLRKKITSAVVTVVSWSFGKSVAIYNDTVVVGGGYFDAPGYTDSGIVALFEKDHGGANFWGETVNFGATVSADYIHFGSDVDIFGDYLAIGAPTFGQGSENSAVHVYKRDSLSWNFVRKLESLQTSPVDGRFGHSIKLFEEELLIGSSTSVVGGSTNGQAYLFNKNEGGADNWGVVETFYAFDGESGDSFGMDIAFSDQGVVVSSSHSDGKDAYNTGHIYIKPLYEGECKVLSYEDERCIEHNCPIPNEECKYFREYTAPFETDFWLVGQNEKPVCGCIGCEVDTKEKETCLPHDCPNENEECKFYGAGTYPGGTKPYTNKVDICVCEPVPPGYFPAA